MSSASQTTAPAMPRLKEKYLNEIRPKLKEELGLSNIHEVPRIIKIVVNAGLGEGSKDFKVIEKMEEELAMITGQKPVLRRAKKDVSGFSIRRGNPIALQVTLRGNRCYEFLDRLISAAIPRIKDFRGIRPSVFDGRGNLTLGIREHTVFPEVNLEKVYKVKGLNVSIATTAENDETALALLKAFGMPFIQN